MTHQTLTKKGHIYSLFLLLICFLFFGGGGGGGYRAKGQGVLLTFELTSVHCISIIMIILTDHITPYLFFSSVWGA